VGAVSGTPREVYVDAPIRATGGRIRLRHWKIMTFVPLTLALSVMVSPPPAIDISPGIKRDCGVA